MRNTTARQGTDFTGPSSFNLALVSAVNGVEAITHTSPLDSLMAVERPPTGSIPNLENGLMTRFSEEMHSKAAEVVYQENVQTSFVTCEQWILRLKSS